MSAEITFSSRCLKTRRYWPSSAISAKLCFWTKTFRAAQALLLYPARSARRSATWWSLTESNRRHPACKAGALPAELRPRNIASLQRRQSWLEMVGLEMVGLGRLELPTSRLSSARSTQLSYKPEVRRMRQFRDARTAAKLRARPWKKEKRRRRLSRMIWPDWPYVLQSSMRTGKCQPNQKASLERR